MAKKEGDEKKGGGKEVLIRRVLYQRVETRRAVA